MASSIDQQFVEFIVKSLVNNPDAVTIERRIDEKGVLLELTVDAEDLGRVIGKRGATAQSLRTLLRALGTKNEARYNLKIIDTSDGEPIGRPTRPQPALDEPVVEAPAEDTSIPEESTENADLPAEDTTDQTATIPMPANEEEPAS